MSNKAKGKKKVMTEEERLRRERKKRIAQAKRKHNSYAYRNREKVKRIERITGISVAAVIVAAIVVFFLCYFGVINRLSTACVVGDTKFTVAEYQCAFTYVENNIYQQSQEYEQSYGSGYFDSDTDLTDTCAYDDSMTWAEYIQQQVYSMMKQIAVYSEMEGNEITDAQKSEMNEYIDSLNTSAQENDYSLGAYIRNVFGTGVNEKVLRDWMEKINRVANAQNYIEQQYKESLTDEEILKHYEENSIDYDNASALYYAVTIEPDEDTTAALEEAEDNAAKDKLIKSEKAKAKKQAADIYNKVKADKSSFVEVANEYYKEHQISEGTDEADVTTLEESDITASGSLSDLSSYPADLTDWMFDSSRKDGDVGLIWSADYDNNSFAYIIVYEKQAPAPVKTVSVRHILIQPEGLDTSEDTDETWAEAKSKAKELLEQWKSGDATEETFGELADANTDDNQEEGNGGLYENIVPGEMVQSFNDWCFDSSRKTGDTGIVKTEYGYHVMYFVEDTGYNWQSVGSEDMADEYFSQQNEQYLDDCVIVGKYSMRWASCYKDYKESLKKSAEDAQEETAE